jgi:hypothetical protein
MPVVINEIIIRSTVEPQSPMPATGDQQQDQSQQVDAIVKMVVQKVLEIMEEKKQR